MFETITDKHSWHHSWDLNITQKVTHSILTPGIVHSVSFIRHQVSTVYIAQRHSLDTKSYDCSDTMPTLWTYRPSLFWIHHAISLWTYRLTGLDTSWLTGLDTSWLTGIGYIMAHCHWIHHGSLFARIPPRLLSCLGHHANTMDLQAVTSPSLWL